ncbi:unnamed protein product [Lymnaea stagnalis]|uniref:Uncharacterized protein n=1 Tax=Lymnaea stagnalis TaxID=6523 RepID=A0AAV2H3W9_LYMST
MESLPGIFFFCYLCVTPVKSQIHDDCPEGWVQSAGQCYRFDFYHAVNYQHASSACQADGAHVVSVNTKEEFNFIAEWLTSNDQNRENQWWTSGVVNGDTLIWEGDGAQVASTSEHWIDEKDFLSDENGNHIVFSYNVKGSRFEWRRARDVMLLPFICEVSLSDAHWIVKQERDHMFGTNITDPNEVKLGPKFIVQPKSILVVANVDQVVIECVAVSNPAPEYAWYRKSGNSRPVLVSGSEHHTITNGKLQITHPLEGRDDGSYQCVASNEMGSVLSESVDISFGYLHEFSNDPPGAVTARQYFGTLMNCRLPAFSPAVNVKWYKEGGGPNFLRTDLHPHQFGSLNGKFYLSEASAPDAGFYHCFVTLMPLPEQDLFPAQAPSKTSLGTELIIVGDAPTEYGPEIHNDFPAVFPTPSLRGETLTLECMAYGKLPLYYSWQRDNGPLPSKAQYSEHDRVITLPNVQLEDSGNYTCKVERAGGVVAEKNLSLAIEAKPFFSFPLKDQHIDIGHELVWPCEALGIPKPTYTWYKNSRPLVNMDGDVEVHANILRIVMADPTKHQGMYQCVATNLHGTSITTAQLRVLAFRPSFARRPLNPYQMGTEGGAVTLVCQPESAPAATITWTKDGSAVSVAEGPDGRILELSNGNLMIRQLQVSDGGLYQCTATNDLGSANSSGLLSVVARTVMLISPSDTVVEVNGTAFLECQASYDARYKDLVYIWDLNGRRIDMQLDPSYKMAKSGSSTGLYITNAQDKHTGLYGCSAVTVDDVVRHTAYLQVYGPPGESGGVVAKVKNRTVTLKWMMGPTNMGDITKFRIEFNTDFNLVWRVLKDDVTYPQAVDNRNNGWCLCTVSDLKPGPSYRFRVIAFNRYGAGPASLPSTLYKIADAAPVVSVGEIRESYGPVGTLAVEWDLLDQEDLTGEATGYAVYYRKKDSTVVETKWSMGTVGGHENKFSALIGVDNYYLEYEIKLAAFNSLGQGPNSTIFVIMSQADMPLGAATKVHLKTYNSTAISVYWTPIPLVREYIRGKVIGYGINYWRPGESMDSSNVYCNEDCGSALLVGLLPRAHYWVNVQVFTTAGMGTVSEDFFGRTYYSAPLLYPEFVTVRSYSSTAVFVHWRGVSTTQKEEPLLGYKIRWWPSTEDIKTANVTVVGDRMTRTVLHGIGVGTVYSLRVMGYSRGGEGKNSPTVYFTLEGQVVYNPVTTEIMNSSPGILANSLLMVVTFGLTCRTNFWL